MSNLDETLSAFGSPRQELVEVLEQYMADLERGVLPNDQALLDAHPELAGELQPYLESLRMLDGATRGIRVSKTTEPAATGERIRTSLRQLGEFQILREVGRGGMGIVYEAHQKSLNRRVALKILPFAAVLDQRQIARFRNEAQAAAQLHHPHIVPVFAVGQEQGVYYYAMQFIDGQSLEQMIEQLKTSARGPAANSTKARGAVNGSTTTLHFRPSAALKSKVPVAQQNFFQTVARLGREAAEALHHAHEHGILHRDVKPSNLLIDGEGKLWVTDFGLARIQNDNGVTLTGDVVGTLRYMSPEQASGTAVVDAQADVYSLGVTLYEMLTQCRAHDGNDRQTLLRQITHGEPVPIRKINPAVPVDLETIVFGAMARVRDERYATAQALADDLGRFLDGKPTLARRPSFWDRAGKWMRRHRPLVAVAASAMVLVTIISAIGMIKLAKEQARTAAALADSEQNAQRALENFLRAEKYAAQARNAVDQFGVRLTDRLIEIPGAESVRHDLLVETLNYYRHFAEDARNDPALKSETAVAHFKSAVVAARLGAVDEAIKEYLAAQKGFAELIAARPQDVSARSQLALAHNNLGLLYAERHDSAHARAEYNAAIRIQSELLEEHAADAAFVDQLAESEANLGMLLDQLGESDGAERQLRKAVERLQRLAESNAADPKQARDLAIAYNNLSYMLRNRNRAAAEKESSQAIDILQRLTKSAPSGDDYLDELALCYANRAALESQKQDWQAVIQWHRRAIELYEKMVRKSPAVVRHRSDLAISWNNLGVAFCRAGKSMEADGAFGRARELFGLLADDYPDELAYRSSLAALLNNEALALAAAERHAEALAIYQRAIDSQRICYQAAPESKIMRDALSKMYYNMGQSLRAAGRYDNAVQATLDRRELWKGNGERLLGVAIEMAELDEEMRAHHRSTPISTARNLANDVLSTLDAAYDSGWPGNVDLDDKRFACFKGNQQFATKIAQLNARHGDKSRPATTGYEVTRTIND